MSDNQIPRRYAFSGVICAHDIILHMWKWRSWKCRTNHFFLNFVLSSVSLFSLLFRVVWCAFSLSWWNEIKVRFCACRYYLHFEGLQTSDGLIQSECFDGRLDFQSLSVYICVSGWGWGWMMSVSRLASHITSVCFPAGLEAGWELNNGDQRHG